MIDRWRLCDDMYTMDGYPGRSMHTLPDRCRLNETKFETCCGLRSAIESAVRSDVSQWSTAAARLDCFIGTLLNPPGGSLLGKAFRSNWEYDIESHMVISRVFFFFGRLACIHNADPARRKLPSGYRSIRGLRFRYGGHVTRVERVTYHPFLVSVSWHRGMNYQFIT